MNIKHTGSPGHMTVEVTGIDSVIRASLARSFLHPDREMTTFTGTEEEYARFRAFLDEAEGKVRVRAHDHWTFKGILGVMRGGPA